MTERLSTHTHTHTHTQSYLGFRDKAEQPSDFASNLPGHCPDWEWLGVTPCCKCRTFSTLDKMGEESWDCWAPEGGLTNQVPGLTTFQVLQDKTNRINMKLGLQFGHRLMMILVCICPVIINGIPKLQSLKSHPWIRYAAWVPFPIGTPDVLCRRTSQSWLSLNVGQSPIWWRIFCSFYLSFLLMLVYWK